MIKQTAFLMALLPCVLFANTSGIRWHEWPGYSREVALVDATGKHLGTYTYADRKYWPKSDGKWGEACDPPIPPPPQPAVRNYGVDEGKLGGTRYTLNGQPCSKERAHSVAGSIPDDQNLIRLTLIGEGREQVVNDLESHPALAPYKGKYLLQAYASDHWAVKDAGFKTEGKPTIYLQSPTGKVLHRQDSYAGAEKLAEALRKAEPNYSPDKDPNLTQPLPAISGITDRLKDIPLPVLALGGIGVFFLLRKGE